MYPLITGQHPPPRFTWGREIYIALSIECLAVTYFSSGHPIRGQLTPYGINRRQGKRGGDLL